MSNDPEKLNDELDKAIRDNNIYRVKSLLQEGANPFCRNGTIHSPIYQAAAHNSRNLLTCLFEPKNMAAEYQAQFKQEENLYRLTAMMGTLSKAHFPKIELLYWLLKDYKGDLSATIPFLDDEGTSMSLVWLASNSISNEPLKTLINCKAKDVKINWSTGHYAIHAVLEQPFLERKDFLERLSLLLSINPERINEFCYEFSGTCLDYVRKRDSWRDTYSETVHLLIKAGATGTPETLAHFAKEFKSAIQNGEISCVPKPILHPECQEKNMREVSPSFITLFVKHKAKKHARVNPDRIIDEMKTDILDKDFIESAFAKNSKKHTSWSYENAILRKHLPIDFKKSPRKRKI